LLIGGDPLLHRVVHLEGSLYQMNVRVHRAVSDIDGVTGMAILRALLHPA
jgi:hypothetical protein